VRFLGKSKEKPLLRAAFELANLAQTVQFKFDAPKLAKMLSVN